MTLLELDWTPLWLTFRLAALTTAILLVIGLPLAAWLARTTSPLRPLAETLVSMPLVLPPSVLGFYLLLAFSPQSWLGRWLIDTFSLKLVFTFEGLVLGSVLFSLPFMVQPLQSALANLPPSLREAAWTLGHSRLQTLLRFELPNIKRALLAGLVLTFAHTVGEFGVVLMIGGNIPGVTKVASIAIYDEVEGLNYAAANLYAGVLFVLSFTIVLTVYLVNRRGVRAL
ncbi:molybdate ABC transporter permease subunit [Laribacter hongkongensis]|uniref:molybdate ABC transporter permease subunit n=1 Tax=Laribacter hongkongensis TaxID=168471 RepID=UPI001EFCF2F6|nr:molybdate ABC transporter permease subunit [Laribacter hongkongensis]MCG9078208.1 molybdate ABC transporter permease subunit [Laribacter hongkongensis]